MATKKTRISRSISFEAALHAHCTRRAKETRRSFNWVVNELVRLDLDAPVVAPAPER